jgi:hypothetical protein
MQEFHSNTLKEVSGEFKTSKLYESVSEETWKIYDEEKEKKTREMRQHGLSDSRKKTLYTSPSSDEFLTKSSYVDPSVNGWYANNI